MGDDRVLDAAKLIEDYLERTELNHADLTRRAAEAGYTLNGSTISNTLKGKSSNSKNGRPPGPPKVDTQVAFAVAIEEHVYVMAVAFLVSSGLAPPGAVEAARKNVAEGLVSPTVVNLDHLPPAGGTQYDTEDLVAISAILEEEEREERHGSSQGTPDDEPRGDTRGGGRRTALPPQRIEAPLFLATDG